MDALGDEIKSGAAGHGDRRAGVMGKDEDVGVIRRIFAPPAFPSVVWPRAADGAEHVAAKDVGSDIFEAASGEVVVDASGAVFLAAVHLFEGASGEEPLENFLSVDAERGVEGLMGSGAETVEGDGEGGDFGFGHLIV